MLSQLPAKTALHAPVKSQVLLSQSANSFM